MWRPACTGGMFGFPGDRNDWNFRWDLDRAPESKFHSPTSGAPLAFTERGGQRIVKPDSVTLPNRERAGHSSCPVITHGVQRPYPRVFRADDPTLLFGLAPGGVYHAFAITDGPVSSYLTFSTLLGGPVRPGARRAVCFLWHFPSIARGRR